MPVRFFLGGYTADMDGRADGVGVVHAGAPDDVLAGGALRWAGTATAAASPSWIAWHPTLDVVYAALEAAGTVQAYRRIGEEAFAPLGAPVPAGETCATSPSRPTAVRSSRRATATDGSCG
ncbi:hypothetical protein [Microbacterium aurum]